MIVMNNNGFTLIELIASIIIIAMLVTIVSISISSTVRDYKESLSKTQISIIEEAANVYYLKEGIKNSYENRSFKLCVNLSYLIENDYIEDESIKNIYDNEKLEGSVEITYKSEYTYKYKENTCSFQYVAVNPICTAVTKETKTTGNIPKGNYLPGDEYMCEVKNNTKYHFFVIETEGNNVNLIMNSNINSDGTPTTKAIKEVDKNINNGIYNLVAWVSKDDYGNDIDYGTDGNNDKGPITAMTYLHNATKDWNNIPNIILEYTDDKIVYSTQEQVQTGYDGINTIQNITTITTKDDKKVKELKNLKARMPYYEEINNVSRNKIWLIDYLNSAKDEELGIEGRKNGISGISGYWTLSTFPGKSDRARIVAYTGEIGLITVGNANGRGVRPVITIPKLDIAN